MRHDRLRSIHPDVARALGAVLQVGHRGPSVEKARSLTGADGLVSFSAHSPSDAVRAARAGADFLFVSPLFRTVSHPDEPPGKIALLRRTRAALDRVSPSPPVFALGGIGPEHIDACLDAGAHGVAVLSGMLSAPDPRAAAGRYLAALAA